MLQTVDPAQDRAQPVIQPVEVILDHVLFVAASVGLQGHEQEVAGFPHQPPYVAERQHCVYLVHVVIQSMCVEPFYHTDLLMYNTLCA